MKGEVLIFDATSNTGKISGHDGKRYNFVRQSLHGNIQPKQGQAVDFEIEDQEAKEIVLLGIQPQGTTVQTGTGTKTRTAFVLLALFLGFFGIHNFYAGYTGRGIAQLLIGVLIGWLVYPLIPLSIWIIVECFAVDKDSTGQKFA